MSSSVLEPTPRPHSTIEDPVAIAPQSTTNNLVLTIGAREVAATGARAMEYFLDGLLSKGLLIGRTLTLDFGAGIAAKEQFEAAALGLRRAFGKGLVAKIELMDSGGLLEQAIRLTRSGDVFSCVQREDRKSPAHAERLELHMRERMQRNVNELWRAVVDELKRPIESSSSSASSATLPQADPTLDSLIVGGADVDVLTLPGGRELPNKKLMQLYAIINRYGRGNRRISINVPEGALSAKTFGLVSSVAERAGNATLHKTDQLSS